MTDTKCHDRFLPLAKYGDYKSPDKKYDGVGITDRFMLNVRRSHGLVVIQLNPPPEKSYLEQNLRLYQHFRRKCLTTTFCTDNESGLGEGGAADNFVAWVGRGSLRLPVIGIEELGLKIMSDLPYQLQLLNGNGVGISDVQRVSDDLDSIIIKPYAKLGVTSAGQLEKLVDTFIGGYDRVDTFKETEPEPEPIKLDRSFIGKVKPQPLGIDIPVDADLLNTITVGDFVPGKQRVGLYCGRDNVGKTAWLLFLVSLLTQRDIRVLYITSDQDAEDLNSYLTAFAVDMDKFHVHSIKDATTSEAELVGLINAFNDQFGKLDLLILDSFVDVVTDCAPSFVDHDSRGRALSFNEYRAADWRMAFARFVNPLARDNDIAIIGTLHSTPKGELNEHAVPLSHRLPGLVEFCFMVFDKDVNPKGAWDKNLIVTLKQCDPEKSTRLLYCRRTRSGSKRRNYFYDLGDEVEHSSVGKDCVRKIVNVREAKPRDITLPTDRKSDDEIHDVLDVCFVIEKLAGGVGVKFTTSEAKVLRAMRCHGTQTNRAPDADNRFNLYQLAKASEYVDFKDYRGRGYTVWLTEHFNKPHDGEANRTQGYQW